jgi:putative transport protein
VGEPVAIGKAADELGDSVARLNHPEIIPIFIGIGLGVLLGTLPVMLPGMPAPVKLGLAGGPLVVAILLSRLGHFGKLVWYLPSSANLMIKELGIVLFLACVGLKSGGNFVATLKGDGLYWMGLAALITIVPLLLVAAVGRIIFKTNYLTLCGLLAGSMTDPPALAFAGSVTKSDAPSVSYATVYPLVMLLRVLAGQAIVLILL